MEKIFQKIVQGISSASGNGFFHLLTELLAEALNFDATLLIELSADPEKRLNVIARSLKGELTELTDLSATNGVWGQILSHGSCQYREHVGVDFPEDQWLAASAAESFLGVALYDSAGQAIGIMAGCKRQPMTLTKSAESMLSVIAVRAAVEIERRRVVDALRKNEERFQAIADFTHDWESWQAPDGHLLWVNPSVLRITGYSPAECLSMADFPRALIHEEDWEVDAKEFLCSFTKQSSGNDVRFRIRCKDRTILWVAASWQPIYDVNKDYIGIRSSIRDISARKEAEEKLEAANRELDAFVYTVSHDLRTPLTPIIGFAEFLREQYQEQLDEQGLDVLSEIEKQGRRMLRTMEDLLRFARVGRAERSKRPISVHGVVDDVLLDLGYLSAEAELNVINGPSVTIHASQSLLFQVFANLIGNALQYAGVHGGPIEVGGEREGAKVRYFVRDHGPGIPPAERSRIFEVFFRGTAGKGSPGSGVGLATVQKIAHCYGGRAWVEETPGGGCTFWVEMIDEPESS
ncbi:PAS domain S-box-containing protein [Desulfuromusa kysingii]|uniref:histidine kinase n=1 Tax=Desulfuromusa kysingii TaxID=37625 RepID=A0A1H3ZRN4_9BACT|nr:ATP-binding protein [Desulfuromusa kysingii]SEA26265.1 PAS domain S-box-containing protein [Desulfuromusa kysingii]